MGCIKLDILENTCEAPELRVLHRSKELRSKNVEKEACSSYEIANHLGNVHVTVSDMKYYNPNNNKYEAVIKSYTDYYPFGQEIAARSSSSEDNTFGFGGALKDTRFSTVTNYSYSNRIYNPGIARFLSVDGQRNLYPGLSSYSFVANSPIVNKELDGNLFIFVNGFNVTAYINADNRRFFAPPILVDNYPIPNPNYNPYQPSREFYGFRDGEQQRPHYKGVPFNYWKGVDEVYTNAYNDPNAIYISASSGAYSQAMERYAEGITAAQSLIKKLDDGDIKLEQGETIKIVGHSQGAAFAAGLATELGKHESYGKLIEFVDYVAPHQPNDFSHPENVVGRQFSTVTDRVSSNKGIAGKAINLINGGSELEQINGVQDYNLRQYHIGGQGGHYIDTWKDYIKNKYAPPPDSNGPPEIDPPADIQGN